MIDSKKAPAVTSSQGPVEGGSVQSPITADDTCWKCGGQGEIHVGGGDHFLGIEPSFSYCDCREGYRLENGAYPEEHDAQAEAASYGLESAA